VANQRQFIEQWIGALERLKDQVRLERISLSQEKDSLIGEGNISRPSNSNGLNGSTTVKIF
jgi:hypothetical protein